MAHIRRDPRTGVFRIRFRYGGCSYQRSLKTSDDVEANAIRGRVKETLILIERGRIQIPQGIQPAEFILSDGKRSGKPERPVVRTLADLFHRYEAELPSGAKEESTRKGERRHQKLLRKHLGSSREVQYLAVANLQDYVSKRSKDRWHGKLISRDTIKKELATFRLIWNWAVDRDYLTGHAPTKGVQLPKRADKPPFMTAAEIRQKISRGGLTDRQVKPLWESLFLTKEEIAEVLAHVESSDSPPFVYPMFVFVAHTGARRSEILRSRVEDFDLHTGVVRIREKKKLKSRRVTYRHVALSPLLADTMRRWFKDHPGGQFTICDDPREIPDGLNDDELGMAEHKAHDCFEGALRGTKWLVVRGFHVFRHSFASNLAAAGVDQRIIDDWMGHQTDEMRRRYRHLFPSQRRSAIELVFGASGQ
jgi:integrase